MNRSKLLLLVPVVFVNLWHAFLLTAKKPNKPLTISEHALLSERRLWVHRAVHCISSTASLAYAYINYDVFGWTTMFLVAGAIFDILEVVTLNKDISKSPTDLSDSHQLTSWLMANSYLLFVLFGGLKIGISGGTTLFFIAVYALLFYLSLLTKFKNFWSIQMTYFVVLSINMLVVGLHV